MDFTGFSLVRIEDTSGILLLRTRAIASLFESVSVQKKVASG